MNNGSTSVLSQGHDIRSKALLLLCVALAYASNFWPGALWRSEIYRLLGSPSYEGFRGLFLSHVLINVTFTAICCAVLWAILVRLRLLDPPAFAVNRRVIWLGVAGGVAALLLSILLVWAADPASLRWIEPDGWKIAGNVFSNFYEEWIFRGFLLVAMTAAIGFWPAAVISSVMWAAMHPQFPLPLQAVLVLMGVGFCWLARTAKSLWAPYTSHMVLDVIADSLIG